MTDQEVYELLVKIDNGYEMSEEEAQELASIEKVDWEDTSIGVVPKSIERMSSLRELNLCDTFTSDISALSRLTSLLKLNLSSHRMSLGDLSDISALSSLTELMDLDLGGTNVIDISPLSQMKSLESLRLAGSVFEQCKVSNISALSGLKSLTSLDLSGTRVHDIGALSGMLALKKLRFTGSAIGKSDLSDISVLSGLYNLEELDLRGTKISDISALSGLYKLKTLILYATEINTIGESLKYCKKLKHIDLSNLILDKLPEYLMGLNLEYIGRAPRNDEEPGIFIKDTLLSTQPISLFQQSRELIRHYYESEKKEIKEAKVIFLGDGGSGKTYTIQRIVNRGIKPQKDTKVTHDIDIKKWKNLDTSIAYEGTIDFWDFGGQDIYLSMHKCFLTERCCYVIVLSNRQRNSQQDLMRQARYWLNNISSFSGKSPILIAVNTWSGLPKEGISIRQLQQDFPELYIFDQVMYDAKDKNKERFNELLERICDMAKSVYSYELEFPKSWAAIRDGLTYKYRNCNYISGNEFYELAEKEMHRYDDFYDAQIAKWLLEWFNDLGYCFNYTFSAERDVEGKDYQILNPKWVIQAMYAIANYNISGEAKVTSPELIEAELIWSNGCLPYRQAVMILEKVGYSEAKGEIFFIFNVLRKLRLSYSIGRTRERYEFIPALCRKQEDNYFFEFEKMDYSRHINYQIKFTFLPDLLLQRLMILCYEKGWEPYSVWRTGIRVDFFGEQYQNSGVSVVITSHDDEILSLETFAMNNQATSSELNTVRNWITEIYQDIGIEPEEEYILAAKGKQMAHIPMLSLLKAREKGYHEFYCHDDGEYESYSIDKLLDDIYGERIVLNISNSIDGLSGYRSTEILSRQCAEVVIDQVANDNDVIDGIILQILSVIRQIQNRANDFEDAGEEKITADVQERIDAVLNYKYGLQISREYTLGHANKKLGETDLYFYRYANGICEPFCILENKVIEKFEIQYEQLMGYLNPDYKCGITLSINHKKTWKNAAEYILAKLQKLQKGDFDCRPVSIITFEEDGLIKYICSEYIVPETDTRMKIYHLILNLYDEPRKKVAAIARNKKGQVKT